MSEIHDRLNAIEDRLKNTADRPDDEYPTCTCKRCFAVTDDIPYLLTLVRSLQAENETLRAALAFYAQPQHLQAFLREEFIATREYNQYTISEDISTTARKALAESSGNTGELEGQG